MGNPISIKVPGRICLFGDHQDYLGLPVISATIDKYIYINAQPIDKKFLEIELPDIAKKETIDLNQEISTLSDRDYFRSAIRILEREGISIKTGYRVQIRGDIPIKAGLSSSSALVVAWIRLLLKIATPNYPYSPEKIAQWSYATEVLEFNEPGGLMDQYTISLGGVVYLDTLKGNYRRLSPQWGGIVIGDSGIEKSTLKILSHLKTNALEALEEVKKHHPYFSLAQATLSDYQQTYPILPAALRPYWYAAIHNHLITQKAILELEQPETNMIQIGNLMNAHQEILQNQLGNTPKPMIKMIECAMKEGAQGVKIVGSGGGGCFVALTPKTNVTKLITRLEEAGVKNAFSVKITPPHHE